MSWAETAHAIACSLAAGAIWHGQRCVFHGATAGDRIGDLPRFRTTGPDLYDGSAGIARFLAHAAARSNDATLRRAALGAAAHAQAANLADWSLFAGAMGIGLSSLDVAETLGAPQLVGPAVAGIEAASVAALAAAEVPFDLLSGLAGVVAGLVWALPYDLDGTWRARAFAIGRRLLSAAEGADGDPDGPIAWPLSPGGAKHLCGLGHGAAGAALAFDLLGRLAPGEPGWAEAARRARAYERAHYDPAHGSWADLRAPADGQPTGPPTYPHMWCHGSVGIAAERLRADPQDRLARADLAGALAGARRFARAIADGPAGPGAPAAANGSQCHGVGGLIDLFLDAWRFSSDAAFRDLAEELGAYLLNDGRRPEGWRSGVPGGWSTPGLMLGDAGIGWAMLRLQEPDLPSAWEFRLTAPAP